MSASGITNCVCSTSEGRQGAVISWKLTLLSNVHTSVILLLGVGRTARQAAGRVRWTLWSPAERRVECYRCWCHIHWIWWPHCSRLACFTASLAWHRRWVPFCFVIANILMWDFTEVIILSIPGSTAASLQLFSISVHWTDTLCLPQGHRICPIHF